MKKIFLFLLLAFCFVEAGKYVSPLKLPTAYLVNLDVEECSQECLVNSFNNGYIFSFLANYQESKSSPEILSFYSKYKTKLNISENDFNIKLAILIPKVVIGRYSQSTVHAILAYLISRNSDFEIKVFNSVNEDLTNLEQEIKKIEDGSYELVFSVLTEKGFANLKRIDTNLKFFIPTINNEDGAFDEKYTFAGINYQKQIEKLLSHSNSKVSIFYDDSVISTKLTNNISTSLKGSSKKVYKNEISAKETKFRKILRKRSIVDSTIFLNLPIVKSSLLLSSITHYNKSIDKIISTQINYNPLILELTQPKDRKEMYIANSIIKNDKSLEEYNKILNTDITYDWINYTSTVIIDYLFAKENDTSKVYDIELKDNNFIYDTEVKKVEKYKL
jgi:SRSO17 transposase